MIWNDVSGFQNQIKMWLGFNPYISDYIMGTPSAISDYVDASLSENYIETQM